MNLLKIAFLQIAPGSTIQQNVEIGLAACKQAKKLGADLAVFPEMWHVGYEPSLMVEKNSIDHQSPFIQFFVKEARDLEMALAITYLGKNGQGPTNNVAIIDYHGNIVLDYAKVHICSFYEGTECSLAAGNSFPVAQLDYKYGSVKIGAMICFDREFPESARSLMLGGAEIIIVPNSCIMHNDPLLGDVRLAQLRSRAYENMVGIALVNYPEPKNDGRSCAFGPEGKILALLQDKEQIATVTFDLNYIRKWQKNELWGSKLRRADCYR